MANEPKITLQLVEQRFGSDSAIGVSIQLDETGETLTTAEYDARFAHLPCRDQPSGSSLLPHGGSATCCTEYARHIKLILEPEGFNVEIVGFANEDNPTSLCSIHEYHPGGHDFAIVDGRFLIDPWVRLVASVEDQIFFDLNDARDLSKALLIYGPRACWKPLQVVERLLATM